MTEREFSIRCDFLRHTFEKLIYWFTAFCAVNVAALGWIISSAEFSRGKAIAVSAWMTSQCILGWLGTWRVGLSIAQGSRRIQALLKNDVGEQSPVPEQLYARVCTLICWAMALTIVIWLAIPWIK